jgi:SAM-dependent MidA family methyltransferase
MRELTRILAEIIQHDGPIPFADFMRYALYHQEYGYYVGGGDGREPVGWQGDYFTSGDLHPYWGEAIARQLWQMWDLLGRPERFDVVEMGPGRGLLARDVWGWALRETPEWAAALHYAMTDRAPIGTPLHDARTAHLAAELARMGAPAGRTTWFTEYGEALSHGVIVGCIVSNELVDAFPVHVLEKHGDALRELYVDFDAASGRFVERMQSPSAAWVASYLDDFAIPWRDFPDGWRAEVCPEARVWMRRVAAGVRRGFVLTIDYGETARRLYTRHRRHGTLAVYSQHQFGGRPLAAPGTQDLTAHVNFSALIQSGRKGGLKLAGITTQAEFLTALGLRERMRALSRFQLPGVSPGASLGTLHANNVLSSSVGDSQIAQLRRFSQANALGALLNPSGLGGFKVLIQQRGVPGARQKLLGLQPPAQVTRRHGD